MPATPHRRQKEDTSYRPEENSKELQQHHCEEFSRDQELEIVARFHDPPFRFIVVYRIRDLS